MNIVTHIFRSTVGRKYIMAVTGLVMFLFVLGHLAGNLQVFGGPEMINRYGHFLQSNLELVWPARVILMSCLVLHVWSAITLSLENRAARPEAYAIYRPVGSTYASRTMLMSGIIAFIFVVYHLLHYTAQVTYINLTGQDFVTFMDQEKRHDIFKMMVVGFSNGWVSAFYLIGVGLICLHLSHGASSMLHSLGWKNDIYGPLLDNVARLVAILVFVGYASIPVAILLGYGREEVQSPKSNVQSLTAAADAVSAIRLPLPPHLREGVRTKSEIVWNDCL